LLQKLTLMAQRGRTVLRWVSPQQVAALDQAARRRRELADQAEELVLLMAQTKLVGLPAQRGREMPVVLNLGLAVTNQRVVAVAALVPLVVMLLQTRAVPAAMAPHHRSPDQRLHAPVVEEVANGRKAELAALAARVAAVRGRRIP
jgi:hypothetical protein